MSAQTPSETLTLGLYRDWLHEKAAISYFAAYRGDLIAIAYGIERLERELAAANARVAELEQLNRMVGYAADAYDKDSLKAHETIDQLRATVARQAEEIERLGMDASRYQWLRSGDNDERVLCWDPTVDDDDEDAARCWLPRQQELDNAIDEAIREDSEATHRPATAEETAAIDAALAKDPRK